MCSSNWLRDDGRLDYLNVHKHHIAFPGIPFSKDAITAYLHVKKLLKEENFNILHCHTPVAATITRMAAAKYRKKGMKVVYTCHGFHFHKKSSLKDWLLYFPIEYLLSFFTDMINMEDYRVSRWLHARMRRQIPGVGVDIGYIESRKCDTKNIRAKYGILKDAF